MQPQLRLTKQSTVVDHFHSVDNHRMHLLTLRLMFHLNELIR